MSDERPTRGDDGADDTDEEADGDAARDDERGSRFERVRDVTLELLDVF